MKELNEAKVLAVGPGALNKDGNRISPSVAPGDKVLIPQVCFYKLSEGGYCFASTDIGSYSMAEAR